MKGSAIFDIVVLFLIAGLYGLNVFMLVDYLKTKKYLKAGGVVDTHRG